MDELYKKLSEIPNRKRSGLVLLIALACGLAWYFLSIRPLQAQIEAERVQMRMIDRKLKQRDATLDKIKNLKANIENKRSQKLRLGEQLPGKADIARLLKKIHERARDAGLHLSSFTPGPTVDLELYSRIEVKMEFRGKYLQILNFINELGDAKGLERIINVEQLRLTRFSNGQDNHLLKGSFLLVTFMSKSNLSEDSQTP